MIQIYTTPQEAEDAFYDALDEADLKQLLSVWAESDDICCLLPMQPLVQSRQGVTDIFTHLFSQGHGVSLAIAHLCWIETDDIAIHQVEETLLVNYVTGPQLDLTVIFLFDPGDSIVLPLTEAVRRINA